MTSHPKFDFYEKVKVITTSRTKAKIAGEIGAVLGRSSNDSGQWFYAVTIYRDGISWYCAEEELESTGEFDKPEAFYDGTSIRVNSRREILQQGAAQHGVQPTLPSCVS